jgi:hypothetical protein
MDDLTEIEPIRLLHPLHHCRIAISVDTLSCEGANYRKRCYELEIHKERTLA